ncbi:MAG: hypothetical protein QF860_05390 [Planctomycetota bacterium]|nr:hypothetical protein [Planctomycetota bacterium]
MARSHAASTLTPLCLAALMSAAASAQGPVDGALPAGLSDLDPALLADVEVHPGERLDPATHGEGVIESMEEAIARDLARPADAPTDPKARKGMPGVWSVPTRGATTAPRSGSKNIVNKWGDLRMGIEFRVPVDLHGVWVGGQIDEGVWPPALRVIGYRDGVETGVTEWFTEIGRAPAWMPIDLLRVDRIVFEARAALKDAAFYTLDDLAFTRTTDGKRELVVIDFEDLAYRAKLTGSGYQGLVWEEGDGPYERGVHAPVQQRRDEAQEQASDAPGAGGGWLGGSGTLPGLLSDFVGIRRNEHGSTTYPPDTCGAVGPDHFVEVINRVFAVYDKSTGSKLTGMYLGSFLPGSNGDPRVHYDEDSGRWIVMVTDFDDQIFLAVSLSSNAMGSWFKTSFTISSSCWPDYPTLGVDENGIYVAAYMVGCSNMTLWAVDKAPLIAPSPSLGTVTAFNGLSFEGAAQPCLTYGSAPGAYIVSTNSSNRIRVRRVNPPLTGPSLVTLGYVNVGNHSDPPNAPALGSSTPLNTVDDRLMNAVYRDGSIWTAHTVNQSGRAACRWYEISPTSLSLVQSGTVSDGTYHYFFPGIAVNASGEVVLGCSGSHAGVYAGAFYTGRVPGDPSGEMAVPVEFRAGQAAQNNIDSYGRNRWGDYSLSSADPDGSRLWTIQEYAHGTNIWGTHVAEVSFGSPGGPCTPTNVCSTSPNSAGGGMTLTYSGSPSVGGADFTLMGFGGPANQLGIFYYGPEQVSIPFGNGVRCIGAGFLGIYRLPVVSLDVFGDVEYQLDWDVPPIGGSGNGQWIDGDTWYVQFWYRDPAAGGANFNFSDALEVEVCP